MDRSGRGCQVRTALAALSLAVCLSAAPRSTTSFDSDWRFLKADAPGAEAPEFADASWRTLNVPHDWSIEGPFDQNNPGGPAGGFLPYGVGWYRKHFVLPAADATRRVFIDFDGVMANSDVWINGFHLGKRPYGYVSFRYELTGHLKFGNDSNVLAVRADNARQPASRWYEGAGIYRHVRLTVTDPVHFEHWATFVSTPKVASNEATVHVQSTVVNQSDAPVTVALQIAIVGPAGKTVRTVPTTAENLAPRKSADFAVDIPVASPEIWNFDHPAMYHAVAKVIAGTSSLDDETVFFGIREFHFDAATGFWLNGKNFKIKGVALHGDVKQLGVNGIRVAHNPVAPEFLDLCDRMGFVVMDEMFDCWTVAKTPYDYHLYFREWSKIDTTDTVRRDRNHPSIVVYSAGNEIHDTPKADLAKEILKGLVDTFHAADPTRPVSQALFRPNVSHDYDNGLADMLDVVGQNYRENEILAAHEAKPTRKILGTENTHERQVWLALRDHAAYAGQFIWCGIDYLGESHGWPSVAAFSGLLDHTGGFKPLAYQRQSWWSDKPMVRMTRRVAPPPVAPTDPGYEATQRREVQTLFADWTPKNSSAHEENVEVYSNCDEVELLLNGKSLGAKPLPADASPRNWRVSFEAGSLKAIGRNKGQVAANDELRTAGAPAKIVLAAERGKLTPEWDDVSYVTASVVDDHGVVVPSADHMIAFHVAGPGVIAAVDSADNASHEPFQASERRAYEGQCLAILKATAASGRITVTASSAGLAGASAAIDTGR